MRRITFLSVVFCLFLFSRNIRAQDFHLPAASPTAHVSQDFSTSFIKVDYSRPSLRGRALFGGQIPYGQVWRTGANQATKITFGEDLFISGGLVKAGSYVLYTIPEPTAWKIILNKGLSNWGADGFDPKDNVAQFMLPVSRVQEKQETFRISVEDITLNSCNLVLAWSHLRVEIPVLADNNQKILDYLSQKLKGDKPPYGQAAGYYLTTGQKLSEAAELIRKAIDQNPKAWYLYWTQAQIYQQLGNHEAAVKAARISADLAKGGAFEAEYEQHYQDLIKGS